MQTIEIQTGVRVGFEDILIGIRQLDNQALTKFAGEVNALLAQREVKTSAVQEAELIKKIKIVIPASMRQRQKQLCARLEADTISKQEKEELELLHNMMENKAAERILLMGELAKLRGITVQQIVAEFRPKTSHA